MSKIARAMMMMTKGATIVVAMASDEVREMRILTQQSLSSDWG